MDSLLCMNATFVPNAINVSTTVDIDGQVLWTYDFNFSSGSTNCHSYQGFDFCIDTTDCYVNAHETGGCATLRVKYGTYSIDYTVFINSTDNNISL